MHHPGYRCICTADASLHIEKLFEQLGVGKAFLYANQHLDFENMSLSGSLSQIFLPAFLPKDCTHRIEILCKLLVGTGFSDSSVIYIYFYLTMKIAYSAKHLAYYGLKCILEISPDSWHICYSSKI